jgi:hypothetical protein
MITVLLLYFTTSELSSLVNIIKCHVMFWKCFQIACAQHFFMEPLSFMLWFLLGDDNLVNFPILLPNTLVLQFSNVIFVHKFHFDI